MLDKEAASEIRRAGLADEETLIVLERLRAQSGAVPHALQMIDSTVALRGTPRQGSGRSRGGFTTRIHLRVNAAPPRASLAS